MLKSIVRWFTALSLLATAAAVPTCQFDEHGNVVDRHGNVVARVAAQGRPRVPSLTHAAGFEHDVVPYSETVLEKLRQDQGWDVMATRDVGLLTATAAASTRPSVTAEKCGTPPVSRRCWSRASAGR